MKKYPKYLHITDFYSTFVLERKRYYKTIMNAETIIKRTTLNGANWQILVNNHGAALFLENYKKDGFHFSGYWFSSVEEAQAHLDGIDKRVSAPQPAFTPCVIPDDYYGVSGRYYGD